MLAMEARPVLDIDEVAQRLKVSDGTIRRLVRAGALRAYRIGGKRGRLRFKEEDVNAYVDSTLVQPDELEDDEEASE
jgi:excisionase family DNA binding protein